jgi:UrcA family protein
MNNSKCQPIRAITIGAAIALAFGAASASAAGSAAGASNRQFVSDGVNSYVVRFADLDLSQTDGAAALYGRLRQAAHSVCSSLQSRDIGMNAHYRACMEQAIDGAVSSIGRPTLSQYHESHTKGDKAALIRLAKAV